MLEVRSALSILLALCFVFHIFSQTGKASSTLLATSAFAFLMLVVRSEVSVTLAFTKGFNHLAGVVLGVVKEVRSTDSDVYFFPHISFQVIIPVVYTHLRAHETGRKLVCRLLLDTKKTKN